MLSCDCTHAKEAHVDFGCTRCHCPAFRQRQPTLFENAEPLARNSDDSTSHEAAAKLTRSGRRNSQKSAVLTAVRLYPGKTAAELADAAGLKHAVCHKRLPDLARDGFVRKCETRECQATGSRATVWRLATEAE